LNPHFEHWFEAAFESAGDAQLLIYWRLSRGRTQQLACGISTRQATGPKPTPARSFPSNL